MATQPMIGTIDMSREITQSGIPDINRSPDSSPHPNAANERRSIFVFQFIWCRCFFSRQNWERTPFQEFSWYVLFSNERVYFVRPVIRAHISSICLCSHSFSLRSLFVVSLAFHPCFLRSEVISCLVGRANNTVVIL